MSRADEDDARDGAGDTPSDIDPDDDADADKERGHTSGICKGADREGDGSCEGRNARRGNEANAQDNNGNVIAFPLRRTHMPTATALAEDQATEQSGDEDVTRQAVGLIAPIPLNREPPGLRKSRVRDGYAELHCLSDFSFQRGASSAKELFERAAAMGYEALAITDECSLAGIVRALVESERSGVRLIVGSEFQLVDGPKLVLLVENQVGYTELCRLITQARRRSVKGSYRITREDLESLGNGLLVLWVPAVEQLPSRSPTRASAPDASTASTAPAAASKDSTGNAAITSVTPLRPGRPSRTAATHKAATTLTAGPSPAGTSDPLAWLDEDAAWIARHFAGRAWIAVELHRGPDDAADLAALQALGERHGLPCVATGDVHMHARERRALQDVMTAIRLRCTVAEAGARLFPNGERHLRTRKLLKTIYPPHLREETLRIAERCTFNLRDVRYEYPHELVPRGRKPIEHLRELAWQGAERRWPQGIAKEHRTLLERELALIEALGYEHFFLTVEDIVRWARKREILCQGRGSAANSLTCYCLGITAVGPDRIGMLFERFLSLERNEPPDIDVDFEHERREEVIQYVFDKYGRHRAALAATVIMYRGKSAARDVGRALGFDEDQLAQLSRAYSQANGEVSMDQLLRESGFDPESPAIKQLRWLAQQLMGSPRHLSQHVGGFVISEHALHTLVPVENASMADRTVIQWDKDDLEELKLLKVDCLALGMLTCLRKSFQLMRDHCGVVHDLASIPEDDAQTYAMIQRADTIGTFQIESRAQMSMLPRLKPANYYDLVVQIAIVRPGPIEGGMVHPYLERRGMDPARIEYPLSRAERETGAEPAVKAVLRRTLGVPIFQEQVMKLVQVVAGFTPGEADQLRRSMGTWRSDGTLEQHSQHIREGMKARGYDDKFAERLLRQIQGFGSYGFPESHSASFALLAYASAWLKCHYPAVFACALLNSQPMGFYAPAQIVMDARRHGVRVLPVDVTASDWDCTLEPCSAARRPMPAQGRDEPREDGGWSLRLGLRLVKGFAETVARELMARRRETNFADVPDLVRRVGLDRFDRHRLAEAGALRGLSGHRHRAHWDSAGAERPTPLLHDARIAEDAVDLRAPSLHDDVRADYATQGLSLKAHPLSLVRPALRRLRRSDSRQLNDRGDGAFVRTAGLVTVRQRPPTAAGVTFLTLEDECGQINLVVWRDVAQRQRRELLEATLLGVDGVVQAQGGVRHLVAHRLHDLSHLLPGFGSQSRDFH
jgi:error-prone DNA polymerase